MNTESDFADAERHASTWLDRLQEAIDGGASADDLAAVNEHLGSCAKCQMHHRLLRRLDAHLRAELLNRPTATERFDARLFARIAALDEEANATARLREERDHRARMSQHAQQWRQFLRFNFGNVLGGAAALAAIFSFLNLRARSWSTQAADLGSSLGGWGIHWTPLLAVATGMAVIAVVAACLIQIGDRRLR